MRNETYRVTLHIWLYGQKLELIKALYVLNEGITIGFHVNSLVLRVRVLGFMIRVEGLG